MNRLILVLLCVACGPRVRPQGPDEQPTAGAPTRHVGAAPSRAEGPPIAFGQMCPDRAAGRAAVSVVLLGRGLSWSTDLAELEEVVASGQIGRFAVHGWDGKRAGVFTVAGATDLGTAAPIAAGGYAGAAVCGDVAECTEATKGCGLAVGGVGREGEDVDAKVGTACVDGGRLHVDLDGDGSMESFAVSDFLDPVKAPMDEVVGASASPPQCTPKFAAANLNPTLTGKGWRGLDLVGVIDLDGDGRFELVLQLRYAEKRTWAIYSATQIATRVELVAEVEPWGL